MKSQKAQEFIEKKARFYCPMREESEDLCHHYGLMKRCQKCYTLPCIFMKGVKISIRAVELAEQELTEQHEKEVAELNEKIAGLEATLDLEVNLAQPRLIFNIKQKAIDSYIKNCLLNEDGYCIADESDCMGVECHCVENFIEKLNS